MSRVDLEAQKVRYDKGINQPRKVTKYEQSYCGPDVPAHTGEGITTYQKSTEEV